MEMAMGIRKRKYLIMSKLFVSLLLLLFTITCVGQHNIEKNNKIDKNMLRYKRFDIEEYKKLVSNNPTAYHIYKEGQPGELIELDDEYVDNSFSGFRESHTYRDSPYEYIYIYNTEGYITAYCAYFHQMPVGKGYQFDGHGNEIKCIDYDLPYKFNIDALKNKMLHQYGINLMDMKQVFSMIRYEEQKYIKRPVYIISARRKDNRNDIYLINGITGETLYIQKNVEISRDEDSPANKKSIEEMYHDFKKSSSMSTHQ